MVLDRLIPTSALSQLGGPVDLILVGSPPKKIHHLRSSNRLGNPLAAQPHSRTSREVWSIAGQPRAAETSGPVAVSDHGFIICWQVGHVRREHDETSRGLGCPFFRQAQLRHITAYHGISRPVASAWEATGIRGWDTFPRLIIFPLVGLVTRWGWNWKVMRDMMRFLVVGGCMILDFKTDHTTTLIWLGLSIFLYRRQ